MRVQVYELNMDGLVGPNHNYAGLSVGNIASTSNALSVSNPQAAALQGIAKMRLLHQLGLKQALLPPHQRPNLQLLHQLGFTGTPAQQIEKAYHTAPALLAACYSASAMWTANAATVSSSLDTADNRVHFTVANLISNLHRHQEAVFSQALLKKYSMMRNFLPIIRYYLTVLRQVTKVLLTIVVYVLLIMLLEFNLFVYGKEALKTGQVENPVKYPARQTLEASQAIARAHLLNPEKVIFARQNPKAIDQGVFHNDVIAVANESILFIHEEAFVNQSDVLTELRRKADFHVQVIEVNSQRLSVMDAVNSYLFNSQLVTLPDAKQIMSLIAPAECANNSAVKTLVEELVAETTNPITSVYYLDLKQSMRNGGGPACLRLRVPLVQDELTAMHQEVLVTEALLNNLEQWVMRHYRNHLHPSDLADPQFIDECLSALDELSQIIALDSIYPFQREVSS